MVKLVRQLWQSDGASGLSRRDRSSCEYEAYVPDLLGDRSYSLDGDVAADVADAEAEVRRLNDSARALADPEALARLLLRAEAVASSRIEGLEVGGRRLLRAEMANDVGDDARDVTATEVLGNIEAMRWATDTLATATKVDVEDVCEIHRRLLSGTQHEHIAGVIRTEQNWIGGSSYNPCSAAFVPPPADLVRELMTDLCEFIDNDDLPAVVQAALVHAQFETIHPFADGNGRVGRVLIAWVLVSRLSLVTPPPVSTRIAADVGGYGSGLVLFRMGDHNAWVRWFAEAVSGAGRAQQELVADVAHLRRAWEQRLAAPRPGVRRLRSNAAAWRALDLLPRRLVLTGSIVAAELAIPSKSANAALRDLVGADVLVEHGTVHPKGRGRPSRLYVSPELLGLTGSNPLRA